MHDHEHSTTPEPERPSRQVSPAAPEHPILALQRQVGNRAVGRMLARMTPDEAMKDFEDVSIKSFRADPDHLARQVAPFTFDRDGWGKVGEAYKKAHEADLPKEDKEKPAGVIFERALQGAEANLEPDARKRVDGLKPR